MTEREEFDKWIEETSRWMEKLGKNIPWMESLQSNCECSVEVDPFAIGQKLNVGYVVEDTYSSILVCLPEEYEFSATWDNAKEIVETMTIGGIGGWHLPTIDKLKLMYDLRKRWIGGFADTSYWSSSLYNSTAARTQGFGSGIQHYYHKSNYTRVRAVRWFTREELEQ